jgi:hypothetical protein
MDYYVIEKEVMEMIVENIATEYFQMKMKGKHLDVDDIHFDKNNAIIQFQRLFKEAFLNEQMEYAEYELIINSLEMRKEAIKQITFDVCQKHALSSINCGNL